MGISRVGYSQNNLNLQKPKTVTDTSVLTFLKSILKYLRRRSRQIYMFSTVALELMLGMGTDVKAWTIRKMFWGRSSFYRSAFHLVVSVITVIAVLSGISGRFASVSAESEGLDLTTGILGNTDILSQSGTGESIISLDPTQPDYAVYKHEVQRGQTLSEIADVYSINAATIKWANELTSDTLKVGQVLKIPEIDGVFIKVKKGDTFESLVAKHGSDKVSIIDLNSNLFDRLDPQLKEGMEIFIPGGVIPTPKKIYSPPKQGGGNPNLPPPPNVPPGTFVHPLGTDPGCSGWTWSRGFTSYHKGADMAKKGGCIINASASGTVIRARWGNGGEGYHIVIDHGNNIWTRYYHGTGQFFVSEGQKVSAGAPVMRMGCTGNCFGTHLHFEVVVNGTRVNPEGYVRLR